MKKIAPILILLFTAACRGQAPVKKVDPGLVAIVDSMLPKLEILAGLKRVRPVALAEQSREELRKYIESRLDKEMPAREIDGIRQTYAAFGLMPDTTNIKALLLDLYQEQVAGYYDPVSDKFYVITGTATAMLRPILAHELVHALQDQHANLDSLISRKRGNDRQTAASAAIEGHATVVMFAYLTQEMTKQPVDPAAMPDLGAQLKSALEMQNSQFPVFQRAPRIIRETVLFPYVGGASFVQQLWRARKDQSYPAPLGSLLPQSTEQILHPLAKFITQRDTPTELRFANTANVIYESTMGEAETAILLSQHLGIPEDNAAIGWDGDRYQLLQLGNAKVIVWQSVWDDAVAADRFANNYKQIAGKRSGRTINVTRNKVSGREGVLVVDGEAGAKLPGAPSVRIISQ